MELPFRVVLITDWSLPDCAERVADALTAGPGIAVQHRNPGASAKEFYEQGLRLRKIVREAPLFINGRLDVALALDAHLHLTENSLTAAHVREHLPKRWISSAWHPPKPAPVGVDLCLVSPVWPPQSKRHNTRPVLGPIEFSALARSQTVPCFALGGVTASRARQLKPLAGVAVVGELMHAPSPAQAARDLLSVLAA